ncbi:FKBP12-associated protein [Malassezia vespertilionis]|uniref:FKBP12-associated protein n=1 Tax=Malassezia vespertilionis TaxID=2020962 RepID=UPI0024B0759C|nr:FKBP12-associated protein [Malassezia vespertilionis]WFD07357.1 FKBP12-associated protein [Malassezia vespertilionis]
MSVSMEGADRPRKTHAAHERRKGRRGKKAQHQQSVHARALDPAAPSFEPAAPTQPRFARREGRAPCRDAAKDAAHSPADPNPPKRASAARSRRKFGTKLGTAHAHDAPDMGVAPVLPPDADLRTRQIAALSHNEYDCTICYNTVARKDAVWSCTRCYTVLHLHCVRKWADRSVKQIEERNAMHEDEQIRRTKGSWRCPGCQDVRTAVPTEYRCWCQRVKNPTQQPIPHACGGACTKGCALHGCAASTCHPGPCPSCKVSIRVACFCGKQANMSVQCRGEAPRGVSCGDVCGKALACGHHACTLPCHSGACPPCVAEIRSACHCGRQSKELLCGDRDPSTAALHIASAWSCGAVCDAPFACGHHTCKKTCHVRAPSTPRCPYDPSVATTCACGRIPVRGRSDCRDPIPSCATACGKQLACSHTCTAVCHSGACPPCTARVTQVCRCGAQKRSIACSASATQFTCDAPCRAQRHCGKHQCARRCCPLAYQATLSKRHAAIQELDPDALHACDEPCRRMLRCGKHTCEAACHRGACPPCLRSSFAEVACHCGRTVLEPPVPCGTTVRCLYTCARPDPPCGHPKVPHACHDDATPCPPCVYLTSRKCVCGKQTLHAVPCSRAHMQCGEACGALRPCGHTCRGACHAPGACPPCTQPCGRPRERCGHPCTQPCHAPSKCGAAPCDAVLVRRCACGHQEKMEVCGRSSAQDAVLACTSACTTAQRNAKFASALGLVRDTSKVAYEEELLRFASSERRTANALEEVLADFIQSPRATQLLRAALCQRGVRVNAAVLQTAMLLSRHYGLETETCTEDGVLRMGVLPPSGVGVDVKLRRARHARIPSMVLTEYLDTHPDRAKRAAAARLATRTAQPAPCNAVQIVPVPAHLRGALDAVLAPATLGGRRSWRLVQTEDAAFLTDITLESLSLAAVASSAAPPAYATLSPRERRLGGLVDELNAVLGGAMQAVLVAYEAGRVERVCRGA